MCGIAGIVASIDQRYRVALQRMTDALAHRGPDGQGQAVFTTCALGHRRLAIVDLDSGAQPLSMAGGRIAVTFNGEIYGYQEIRRAYHDFPYRTNSDTEVILALYARHGAQTPAHLPGMFAFALWDDERQELLAARDRFGEKPFYYAVAPGGEFIFASEIKAILASGLIEPTIDRRAVARYLTRQCVGVDQSIYANVRSLPPAHMLRLREGRIEVSRYWSPPMPTSDLAIDDAVDCLRSLLRQAVQRQLVADVPVGAFLSGGVDSSTICLVASELVEQLRTFSFDFEGAHSEIAYARAAAAAYGTRHVELSAHGVDLADGMATLQRVYDEPFADTSALPTYLIAREARRHLKVVLTGDGGDELFGGYAWYRPLYHMAHERPVGLLRWTAARIANRISRVAGLPGGAAREYRIMGMGMRRGHRTPLAAHQAQMAFFDGDALDQLGLEATETNYATEVGPDRGTLDDVLRSDVQDYMAADILTKIDRAAMAHGLELRAPFLDVEFATFCLSLPYRLKITRDEDKVVLRRAYAEQWPAPIRKRSKQGFGAPLARWLDDRGLRKMQGSLLDDAHSPLYDIVSFRGTRRLLRRATPMQRWTLLILALWLSQAPTSA
jgi:asparagine synthase (glutamine-hydrolysing)